MKKIISICLSISLLCACGGMRGLQRQSTQNIHKTINENNEMYWNDTEGHTNDVKMVVQDKYHAQIEIPIVYTEDIEQRPQKLPQTTTLLLQRNDLSSRGVCKGCVLNNNNLTIPLEFSEITCGSQIVADILIFPLTIVLALVDFQSLSKQHKQSCNSTLQNHREIKVIEDWDKVSLQENGVNATIQVIPEEIEVSCNKKSCQVVDKENKLVNRIMIHKHISFNKTKIEELFVQEEEAKKKAAQQEAQRKAEEAKRKADEAKRKAEEERQWKQKQRLQKKECPNLYRTLYWAQQTGYIDPIIGMKTAQRFDELDCGFWLNQQMY